MVNSQRQYQIGIEYNTKSVNYPLDLLSLLSAPSAPLRFVKKGGNIAEGSREKPEK